MDGSAAAGMDGGAAKTSASGAESKSPPDSVNTEWKELIPPIWLPKYHPPNCHQYPVDDSLSDGGWALPLLEGAPWKDEETWLVGNNEGGGWVGDVSVWHFTIQNKSGWPQKTAYLDRVVHQKSKSLIVWLN